MVLALLSQVLAKVGPRLEGEEGKKKIVDELKVHKKRLEDRQVEVKKEQVELDKEAAKYITSDDLHVGFESKTVSKYLVVRTRFHPTSADLTIGCGR
jgi:cell division cycle protein 37